MFFFCYWFHERKVLTFMKMSNVDVYILAARFIRVTFVDISQVLIQRFSGFQKIQLILDVRKNGCFCTVSVFSSKEKYIFSALFCH